MVHLRFFISLSLIEPTLQHVARTAHSLAPCKEQKWEREKEHRANLSPWHERPIFFVLSLSLFFPDQIFSLSLSHFFPWHGALPRIFLHLSWFFSRLDDDSSLPTHHFFSCISPSSPQRENVHFDRQHRVTRKREKNKERNATVGDRGLLPGNCVSQIARKQWRSLFYPQFPMQNPHSRFFLSPRYISVLVSSYSSGRRTIYFHVLSLSLL